MHKKQMSISSLNSCTGVISVADQSLIKGGGDCPPMQDPGKLVEDILSKVFNGLNTSTLTPDETGLLTGYLTTLAGNQLGQDILQGIENSGAANLKWGDFSAIGSGNFDGNQVSINFPKDVEPDGYTFTNVAHELFHVYEKFVGGDASPSFAHEIEAYLFAAMVDQEVDNQNPNVTGDSSYYLQSGALIAGFNTKGTDEGDRNLFDTAWNAIISGKSFTADNMNHLIDNFANGSNGGGAAYGGMSDDDIKDLKGTALNNVFPCFTSFSYKNPPTPGGGGGGGAPIGGGGGESDGDPYDPGFGWLNSSGSAPAPPTSVPSGSYREV